MSKIIMMAILASLTFLSQACKQRKSSSSDDKLKQEELSELEKKEAERQRLENENDQLRSEKNQIESQKQQLEEQKRQLEEQKNKLEKEKQNPNTNGGTTTNPVPAGAIVGSCTSPFPEGIICREITNASREINYHRNLCPGVFGQPGWADAPCPTTAFNMNKVGGCRLDNNNQHIDTVWHLGAINVESVKEICFNEGRTFVAP